MNAGTPIASLSDCMETSLDCIPCFVRQALEAVRFVTDDPALHERVLREVLAMVAKLDLRQSPPVVAQEIHRRLRELTHQADPYRGVKDRFNRLGLRLLPELLATMAGAADPLRMATRLAIAGNVIDLGVNGRLTGAEVRSAMDHALVEPFCGDMGTFREAISTARRILYLADNAGEICFDRLLIERLPTEKVTLAVRGGPVINDATLEDARAAGLHEIVEVVGNGSDAPGTILGDCSPPFRRRYERADLIIAKGQGNFETLSEEPKNIFFLFKVKCAVIAARAGQALGTHVLLRGPGAKAEPGGVAHERQPSPGNGDGCGAARA